MTELVEFDLQRGGSVIVEVAEDDDGDYLRAGGVRSAIMGVAGKATESLEAALDGVRSLTAVLVDKFGDLPGHADQTEVQFGVKLSGKVGVAVLASSAAEGHLQVTMRWRHEP
jgi:hypothetical protein